MKLSIIGTLYHSEEFIHEFYARVVPVAKKITQDYEIIFVNDGSPDKSKEVILKLQHADPRITLIDLSRNFGHHKAIMTGLNFASGDYIFLIDTDLEEDPEHLYKLWNVLESDPNIDVVYGIQSKRKGKWFEQSSGSIYYKLIYLVTGQRYPANTLTARVMTKRYVEGLKNFDEKEFDIWTLFVLNGFEQKGILLSKKSKGTSSYTLRRKIRIAIDIITSFTTMPLYLIALLGVLLFLVLLFMASIYYTCTCQRESSARGQLLSLLFGL